MEYRKKRELSLSFPQSFLVNHKSHICLSDWRSTFLPTVTPTFTSPCSATIETQILKRLPLTPCFWMWSKPALQISIGDTARIAFTCFTANVFGMPKKIVGWDGN